MARLRTTSRTQAILQITSPSCFRCEKRKRPLERRACLRAIEVELVLVAQVIPGTRPEQRRHRYAATLQDRRHLSSHGQLVDARVGGPVANPGVCPEQGT